MSEKREPLLSDEAITARSKSSYDYDLAWAAIDYGRNYYERLIDEGKLRVVEEVEAIERWSFIKCSGCGLSYPWEADALIETINFCPGCGGKIRR